MSTPSDGRPARKPNSRTMRLPGSVAEAQASPPGPEIGIGEFLGVVQSALNHQLGRADEPDGHPQSITEPKARTGRLLGDHFGTTRYAR